MKDEFFEYMENQETEKFEKNEFLRKRAEYEYVKNRKFMLYGIMFSVIGLVLLLIKDLAYDYFDKQFTFVFIIFGASSFACGIGFILYRYLQNGSFSKFTSSDISNQNLRSELQNLKFEIIKLRKKDGNSTDYENISKTINDSIDSTITEDFIKSKIDSFYSEKAISESKRKNLLDDFESLSYCFDPYKTRVIF